MGNPSRGKSICYWKNSKNRKKMKQSAFVFCSGVVVVEAEVVEMVVVVMVLLSCCCRRWFIAQFPFVTYFYSVSFHIL